MIDDTHEDVHAVSYECSQIAVCDIYFLPTNLVQEKYASLSDVFHYVIFVPFIVLAHKTMTHSETIAV